MSDQSHDTRDRLTVPEAAKVLRISESAVRKRVERGKLQAERTSDGRLIVYLDTSATTRDHVRDKSQDTTTVRYVRSLEDQVAYLRNQLAEEREARRRADTVIAQLSAANAEQARTIRAIEAPVGEEEITVPPAQETPSEPPEAPTAATPQPGRVEPQTTIEAADEAERAGRATPESAMGGGSLRRPWWRRLF